MRINMSILALAMAGAVVAACSDSDDQAPRANAVVSINDQCDSATFNAGLGAGTCTRAGNTTLAAFNSELTATQKVAAWNFEPASFTIHVGQSISAMNMGGEDHTFTEVENFGGGIIPALNTASGNLTEAPECAALSSTDHIAPGATFNTDAETQVGTEHYQCCIHPWMRATVTVTQ